MSFRVVFDGANITFPNFDGGADLDRFSAVVLGVCDRLGLNPSTDVVSIFDAGFHNRLDPRQREELRHLRELWGQDRLAACPAGQPADAWILDAAHMMNAIVVSGDRFKDHTNRKGAVVVPVLHVAGAIVLRKGVLMGENEREDIEVELDTIFPAFAERRLAPVAPKPLSSPLSEDGEVERVAEAVLQALKTAHGEPWSLERLADAVGAETEHGWLERACMWIVLRQLQDLTVMEDPRGGVQIALKGGDASDDGWERLRAELIRLVDAAPGGEIKVATLATLLGQSFPNGQFKTICEARVGGSPEGRFLRLLRELPEIEGRKDEQSQWRVRRRR